MQYLTTALSFLRNKALVIVALIAAMIAYDLVPPLMFDPVTGAKSGGMMYAELLYGVILILASTIGMPIVRLLIFPEIAHYAEKGGLDEDLNKLVVTNMLRHYWFGSGFCFVICMLVLITIHH